MAMGSSDLARSEQTMEALGDFLLTTKRAVERLSQGHIRASMHAFQQRRSEEPSAFSVLSSSGKGNQRPSATEGRGKTDQSQSWSFPYPTTCLAESVPQSKGKFLEKPALVAYRSTPGKELEHAVGFFIKDLKKTVDAWCSRYRMLVDGRMGFMPEPLHTGMEVMHKLHYDADQGFSIIAEHDVYQVRDSEVLRPCAQNGKQVGMPYAKHGVGGNRRRVTTSRTNRSKAHASTLSLQGTIHTVETAHNRELSQKDIVSAAQEHTPSDSQSGSGKMNMNHTFEMEEHGDHNNGHCKDMGGNVEKASTDDCDLGESITGEDKVVKYGSLNDIEKKATDDAESSPVETDELTIRQYQYKVEVVESPDWLPKGWITELKTRGFGGSAGCKDKYYYDPVSKRRCRSQKEVFCFLETGKLGRYKKRTKLRPENGRLGVDLEKQVDNNQREISGGPRTTSSLSQSNNMPRPLAIFPGAGQKGVVGSSTFLPYRPGQTSNLLYESMAGVSRSSMDRFPFMDLSSGRVHEDRNSATQTWHFCTVEGSAGPRVDRFEAEKAGKGGGRPAGPKRPRKPSKRPAS